MALKMEPGSTSGTELGGAGVRPWATEAMATMTNYDVGGFRINLRAGMRDSIRAIDLVTITAEGKVIR